VVKLTVNARSRDTVRKSAAGEGEREGERERASERLRKRVRGGGMNVTFCGPITMYSPQYV